MSNEEKNISKVSMEEYLGDTLIMPDGSKHKTTTILKDCDLVALYFSASWCPPCQSFSPLLVDFYKRVGKKNNLQIVFVSSDRDNASFMGYFKKMPWLAMPLDATQTKQKLATMFQIQGIPSLIVLDGKNGNYVTNNGRNDVMSCNSNESKEKELIQMWKSKESVPVHEANLTPDQGPWYYVLLKKFLTNPIYLIGTFYMVKSALQKLNDLGKDDGGENADL